MTTTARARLVALLWMATVTGVLVVTLHETRVGGSVTAFLPQNGTVVQRTVVSSLQSGTAAHLVLMALTGGTAAGRRMQARALVAVLARHRRRFTLVAAGPRPSAARVVAFLTAHRYLLAPRQSWSRQALHHDLVRALAVLESPAGLGGGAVLADPTGAMIAAARPWRSQAGPPVHAGVWTADHGRAVLLLAQTRRSGFAMGYARRTVRLITRSFRRLNNGHHYRLQLGGTSAITVATNRTVARSARQLAIIDSVLVAIILLFIYRAIAPILTSLVPMVSGAVVATATVAMLFPTVSVITLGFGTMLIGVAMDYPAYVLLHVRPGESVAHAAARVAPTLRLAVTAMALGFATMWWSQLAGLVQLAVFASAGLVAAAAAARYLVPPLLPAFVPPSSWTVLDHAVGVLTAGLRKGAWLVPVALIVALGVLVHAPTIWDNGVRALSPVNPVRMARTQRLAQAFGVPGFRYELLATGANTQSVLRRSERLMPVLAALRHQGDLRQYDLAARYLPSVARQRRRAQTLPTAAQLRRRLHQALVGLPIRRRALRRFEQAVARARSAPPVRLASLPAPLQTRLRSLLTTIGHQRVALIPLSGVRHTAAIAQALRQAAIPGVHFVAMHTALRQLLRSYRRALLRHSLLAAGLMLAVIAWGLRSVKGALRILGPMMAAVLVTAAVLVEVGLRLTLLNVVALLLIAGLGMGYALFLGPGLLADRRPLAPWMCAATTISGFGVMAATPVAMLATVGLTVSIGALLALLFTAAWSPRPS